MGPAPLRVAELRGLPLLGKLLDFRRDRLGLQFDCARAGDVVRFSLLHWRVWGISAPELVHEILVAQESSFVRAPGLGRHARVLLGDGLLTSAAEGHRRKRKLLAPAFAPRRMAGYGAVMAAGTERAARRWSDGQRVDIADEMMRLTLGLVGKTLFDADLEGEAAVIGEAMTAGMEFIMNNMSFPLPSTWPLPRNQRMRAARARLDAIVYRIIAARRAAPGDRGDVLSMLLEARDDDGSGLTDRELRDETITLMLAGHETTAVALTWTWYLLAQHPAAYDRLLAEVDAALGGRTPTVEDLARLPWTLQVIEEAMRLYPPAYVLGRVAARTVRLGPVTLAPGDAVMVSIRAMHQRPDLWPEPAQFRPERMADEAKRQRPRHAYMPFGAGPRICIGSHFALTEAHLVIATLAQRWRFRLAQRPDVEAVPLVTLRPRGAVRVEVMARR